MAIPEHQLDTWSAQGSIAQSAQTYQIIRNVLNSAAAPYHHRQFSIFLQGSYGNHTNVWKDSDVDIVICLTETIYSGTADLTPAAKENYERRFSRAAYQLDDFRKDVLSWLQAQFGNAVTPGKKAISIKGSGNRRDADILVCAKFHRYRSQSTGVDGQYDEGITFWSGPTQIVNFPKQHSDNCTTKHQYTSDWFKPVVRMYKSMRNRMVDGGYLGDGVAPSYFIEGMLWNVPSDLFGGDFEGSFINTYNWVLQADKTKLACANDLFWLVREYAQECWPTANFDAYLAAVRKYWDEWDE